ncbi:AlbA family DNA-binding domain-containing protein [Streptomyces mirabilis]
MFDARLRTLLGCAPQDATFEHFEQLLHNDQAVEGPDLDYKGTLYGSGTEAAGELAKDVAALANASGGTLVLGMWEDKATSAPKAFNPLPLTDRLRKDYREWLALRLDPPVQCDIRFVAKCVENGTPKGLVIISVPSSGQAPHAVVGSADLRDGTLRFPVRNDNTTTFMNLAYVKRALAAAEYQAASRRDVLEKAESEVFADRIERGGERLMLTVTLVPDLPGFYPIDSATFSAFRGHPLTMDLPFLRVPLQRFGVGPRRFTATDAARRPRNVAHFRGDGSAAWAVEGPAVPAFPSNSYSDGTEPAWHVDRVVLLVLTVMQHLTQHARRAAVSGTASLRVRLNSADGPQKLATELDRSAPHDIGTGELEIAIGESSLLLEDAGSGERELVRAAAAALADLFQNFGVVEAEQLTLDGQINLNGWAHRYREHISTWAARGGVEILVPA